MGRVFAVWTSHSLDDPATRDSLDNWLLAWKVKTGPFGWLERESRHRRCFKIFDREIVVPRPAGPIAGERV